MFDAVCKWGRRQLEEKRVEDTPDNLRDEVKDLIPLVRCGAVYKPPTCSVLCSFVAGPKAADVLCIGA